MSAAGRRDRPAEAVADDGDSAFLLDGIRDGLAVLRLAMENADSRHEPEALAGLADLLEDTARRAARLVDLERRWVSDRIAEHYKAHGRMPW